MSDWYHTLVEDIKHEFMSTLPELSQSLTLSCSTIRSVRVILSRRIRPTLSILLTSLHLSVNTSELGTILIVSSKSTVSISMKRKPTSCTCLVTPKNSTEKNYGIFMVADSSLLDTIPSDLLLNQTNQLEYN
jgi:iron transport multicopper oxidase